MSLVHHLIHEELHRQQSSIELIASENYQSSQVLAVQSSCFANKYAEGYPGRRYYGGQQYTDQLESYAIAQAVQLFRADHANVQALSGAAANIAIFNACCDPGDTILGMNLSHGGHLTHGSPVTMMSNVFHFVGYQTQADGSIDYDQVRSLALAHRPRVLLAGFSAYPRQLDYAQFVAIAREVDAIAFADMSHIGGLIAAGVLPNPLDAGFDIMMTTTHKSLRGPRGALILSRGQVSNPLKAVPKTREHLPTLIDRSVFPGVQGGPHMNTIAGIAVALEEAATEQFVAYGRQVLMNAQALADEFEKLGYRLVAGGTDNHLIVIDTMSSRGIDGHAVQQVLDSIHISASKSPIPDDTLPPFRPSGLRLGTPAMTTRGATCDHMRQIARWIDRAILHRDDETVLSGLRQDIESLALSLPLPA